MTDLQIVLIFLGCLLALGGYVVLVDRVGR
jgi:hypothetical protein